MNNPHPLSLEADWILLVYMYIMIEDEHSYLMKYFYVTEILIRDQMKLSPDFLVKDYTLSGVNGIRRK